VSSAPPEDLASSNPVWRRAAAPFALKGHLAKELAGLVRPRRGFRRHLPLPKHVKLLGRLIGSVDELSASVQDLERDGKGLPVLIRQYMKVGGQFLGFNVDPHFSNALDALVLADLRSASIPMLERLMGRAGAEKFSLVHRKTAPPKSLDTK
jgi:hypothetical protein